jgi:hypothetical protein
MLNSGAKRLNAFFFSFNTDRTLLDAVLWLPSGITLYQNKPKKILIVYRYWKAVSAIPFDVCLIRRPIPGETIPPSSVFATTQVPLYSYNTNQRNAWFSTLIFNFCCRLRVSNLSVSSWGRKLYLQHGMFYLHRSEQSGGWVGECVEVCLQRCIYNIPYCK